MTAAAWFTAAEETRVARQARSGDLAARNALAARHHPLVFALARSLARRLPPGMEMADLIQEGFLGLYRAAQHFDPERGCRFTTYATWAVRSHMAYALARWRYIIRLPDDVQTAWGRLLAAQERAAREGREVTLAELVAVSGCSLPTMRRMLAAAQPPVPLDAFWSDGEEARGLRHELLCPRAPSEAAIVLRLHVAAAVARLPRDWQILIRHRFGLDGGGPYTQREVAEILGCSHQWAGQMERKALARLEQLMGSRRRWPQAGG